VIREESDIDPEDPDHYQQEFLPSDRTKWNHNKPKDRAEHNKALEEFEARRQTRIFMNLNTATHLAFGVTKEVHVEECNCSYCGNNYDKGTKPGLNVPPAWTSSNAWFVWMTLRADGAKVFYRTTRGSFLRSFLPGQPNQAA
jgi:hypothetical protein